MKNIFAVIPAYNEGKRVKKVIEETRRYVDKVILVNDHSKDDTSSVAKSAGAFVVDLTTNMGVGFATRIGCDIAVRNGADTIVTLDADGQHDPADIPKLLDAVKEGYDVVFGSRHRNKTMPFYKRIGNYGLSLIARLLFQVNVHDSQTGFHAFSKEVYDKIRWESTKYGMVSEFVSSISKHKLRYKEVGVKTIYVGKKDGMRKRDAIKAVISMLSWRLKR